MEEPTIEDLIKALPPTEKVPVAALYQLQLQRFKGDEEQEACIRQIKKKYQKLKQPHLDRVSQILKGANLYKQELEGLQKLIKPNQNLPQPISQNALQYKGKIIKEYWPSVISNSVIGKGLSESEEKMLNYLIDVKIVPNTSENTQNVQTLTFNFTFKQNPYFQQKDIVRVLKVHENQQRQPICIEGTTIKVKELGNTLLYEMKKVVNKKTGQSKTTLGKKKQTFFDIFFDQNQANPNNLLRCGSILLQLESIIENSVDYFLGIVDVDDEGSDLDDEEYQDEQEDFETQNKNIKKKK